jgi:2-methylisocitrate lyase-like PEP mutase family enzyme
MTSQPDKAQQFLQLHDGDRPLLLPNPWDIGAAVLFASMGFQALATTSSGHAASLGRPDGQVSREEALAHAEQLVNATRLPVSADLENCFADDPEGVAATVQAAAATGLAGCSIEDYSGTDDAPIYDLDLARARVEAAAEAAHSGPVRLVLTARAENHLHGRKDLADTIARLQAYQEAGADVLYAPGVVAAEEIRQLVRSVDRPVNVLAMAGCPSVAELGELGVRRVSVGGAFAFAAYAAATEAAHELLDQGTYGYAAHASAGREVVRRSFR